MDDRILSIAWAVLSILLPVLAVLMILSTLIDWGRPSWRPRHSGKEKGPARTAAADGDAGLAAPVPSRGADGQAFGV